MRGALFIIIIALLSPAIVRHVQGAGGFVVVKNCTDRALCFSGCTSYTLQTDQCFPTNEGSQVITCPPAMSVCGDLAYFTDSACENLLMMDAFLCDQCNQNNAGEFTTAVCSREGIFEFLELASCTSQCGSCSVGGNMTRDTCIPFGRQQVEWAVRRNPALASLLSSSSNAKNGAAQLYAKYRGARICNGIRVEKWNTGSVTCAARATQSLRLPENACIEGLSVACGF